MSSEEGKQPTIIGQITDLLGLSSATDRLLTFFERGIGPAFGPIFDRWRNLHSRADARQQIAEMRSLGLDVTGVELTVDGRAELRVRMERLRQQDNREAIAAEAVEEMRLIGSGSQSSEAAQPPPVELEWLDHFWDLAGRVSSADRQALWGRVLARSAVGRLTSARALTMLSTLSGEEAREIELLAKYTAKVDNGSDRYLAMMLGAQTSLLPSTTGKRYDDLNRTLSEKVNGRIRRQFEALGIFVGSSYAEEFHQLPVEGELRLELGAHRYRLRGLDGPVNVRGVYVDGLVLFGNGLLISPIGEELFALIQPMPDPEWLGALAEIYSVIGWQLCDDTGVPVPFSLGQS